LAARIAQSLKFSTQSELPGEEYLGELARVAIESPIPEELGADTKAYCECRAAGAPNPQAMTELLKTNPQLQEQLAFFLDYVPSKWLLSAEIPSVLERRKMHNINRGSFSAENDPYDWAYKQKLQGICLSGGGIRSATFNLGLLQGLAALKLLPNFDYLSSVSGGGYIHEWLAAWIKREDCQLAEKQVPDARTKPDRSAPFTTAPPSLTPLPEPRITDAPSAAACSTNNPPPKDSGLSSVQARLRPLPAGKDYPFTPEPIRWLRRYSNYLTPQKGLLTADTWVAVAIWVRNTFLNQLILTSFLFSAVLLPYLICDGQGALIRLLRPIPILSHFAGYLTDDALLKLHRVLWAGIAISLFMLATGAMWYLLFREHTRVSFVDRYGVYPKEQELRSCGEKLVLLLVVLPLLAACFVLTHALVLGVIAKPVVYAVGCLLAIQMAGLALAGGVIESYKENHGLKTPPPPPPSSREPIERVCVKRRERVAMFLSGTKVIIAQKLGKRIQLDPDKADRRAKAENQARVGWRVFVSAILASSIGNGMLAAAGGVGLFLLIAALLRFPDFTQYHSITLHHPRWVRDVATFRWRVQLALGPPFLLCVPFFTLMLGAGLVGRNYPDWLREWLAHVRAWCLLLGLAWLVYFSIALLGPELFEWVKPEHHSYKKLVSSIKWSALFGWIATTIGSVLAGNSRKATGTAQDSSVALNVLAETGPYVFILGLFLLLSELAQFLWRPDRLGDIGLGNSRPLLLFLLPIAIFLLFGWRVDVNEFSMNAFYRNRLTRCYLGATNGERDPNPLTGFDDRDTRGLQISSLQPKEGYSGPLPIINTTLNLTFGEDLAWQERKAASFFFSPIFSGYTVGWTSGKAERKLSSDRSHVKRTPKETLSFNGFVPTSTYYTGDGGINIATAVAISGAAASPNWGYHTNPATAFLMTLFNVRLGWWIYNPRRSRLAGLLPCCAVGQQPEWPSPRFALLSLGRELLGMANDTSKYVYLSDGGHFDNMGLYELVRRRCYRIVICDAEADEKYMFEGLGNAIRKCRIDFGVEIDLKSIVNLREKIQSGNCKAHFVTGTIRYPETPDGSDTLGKILYIKSSLTGNAQFEPDPKVTPPKYESLDPEPPDIFNYKLQHWSFPHDTTANQWFTESQFESYRRLGQHVAEEVQRCQGWRDFS
jgi:hypothetical protein